MAQKSAWVDRTIFREWFGSVFIPYVRKRNIGESILLLVDNARGHEFLEEEGVRVAFFPANCTSIHQPMDQGIIAAVKKRYRTLLLCAYIEALRNHEENRKRGDKMKKGMAGIHECYPANLTNALNFLKVTWENICQNTIVNCWIKAGILPSSHLEQIQNQNQQIFEEIKQVDNFF